MSEPPYLLDTSVVLALARGSALGTYIDDRFDLRNAAQRPLVCVVTLGEVRVLAQRNGWGERKLAALEAALGSFVVVKLDRPAVIDCYVEIDLASQAHPDGARNMGKNDLWVAAAAKAAGARLLTTDKDFEHLFGKHVDGEFIDPRVVTNGSSTA